MKERVFTRDIESVGLSLDLITLKDDTKRRRRGTRPGKTVAIAQAQIQQRNRRRHGRSG